MDCAHLILSIITFGFLYLTFGGALGTQYVRDTDLDGYMDTNNIILASAATSVVDCAKRCTGSTACTAFYYTPLTRNCSVHSQLSTIHGVVPQPGTKYYHIGINLAGSFTCPVPGGDWVTGQVSPSGEIYQFRIFYDYGFHQQEAVDLCQSYEAQLPQVTTLAKLQFYQDNIFGVCSGVHQNWYYVDGSNSDAVNYYAPDAYTTINGDVLDVNSGLWYPSRPNYPGMQHCVVMQESMGYMLNDKDCSGSYHMSVICERPLSAK